MATSLSPGRPRYPSDLTDAQWTLIEPLLPPPNLDGRHGKHPRREVVNAIFYVLRTGCAWRLLPHDLPPWQTVYGHFARWRDDGTVDRVHEALRDRVRDEADRDPMASAGIVDAQSVKGADTVGADSRGYDAANASTAVLWSPESGVLWVRAWGTRSVEGVSDVPHVRATPASAPAPRCNASTAPAPPSRSPPSPPPRTCRARGSTATPTCAPRSPGCATPTGPPPARACPLLSAPPMPRCSVASKPCSTPTAPCAPRTPSRSPSPSANVARHRHPAGARRPPHRPLQLRPGSPRRRHVLHANPQVNGLSHRSAPENGRKTHVVTDTLGLLLVVMVIAASVQDRDGGKRVLDRQRLAMPSVATVFADGGYAGRLVAYARRVLRVGVEVVRKPADQQGFAVLPRRWVVERTLGWLVLCRRLRCDYERRTDTAEAMTKWAMWRILRRRPVAHADGGARGRGGTDDDRLR
jgi:transposase